MNRRKFLAGLAAVPTAVVLTPLALAEVVKVGSARKAGYDATNDVLFENGMGGNYDGPPKGVAQQLSVYAIYRKPGESETKLKLRAQAYLDARSRDEQA